jgi:pimeloyl-ACP methyl ester carboxylesterase
MPVAQLPGDLQMYYEDDDFTDPWTTAELTPILPQITTPALVLVGEGSMMNTSDRTRSLAELLPKGRLVEVPGASGYVQHSAPAQCVAIWRDFVKTVR